MGATALSNPSGSVSGAGTSPRWIIASRSRCSISRTARRLVIAIHSTPSAANTMIDIDDEHDYFFVHALLPCLNRYIRPAAPANCFSALRESVAAGR